ncbi:MAG: aldo/keto reductase [Acidobacteriota bacterium]|nr:aldo/keto reductase [Acidobacteriota bacterium]
MSTRRKLGNSGLEVSTLCFGGNVFGWTADEPTSFELLDAFVTAGFNFIDTADVYSTWVPGHHGGESEAVIGKWLKQTGKRKDVVIATKVGMEMGAGQKGLSKKYIQQAVEQSLKRLQTDYIDLYQSHTDDGQTPLEETLSTFAELIQQGKVRAIGASNYSAQRLTESLRVSSEKNLPRYEVLQPLYNLYDRAPYETDLENVCVREGLGVITYFSLAAGFLSGKYRSDADLAGRERSKTVKKYLNDRGFKILGALDRVAKDYGVTPAQIALAWVMARPSVTAPIASATNLEQLDSLIKATELQLSEDAVRTLDEASTYSGTATA